MRESCPTNECDYTVRKEGTTYAAVPESLPGRIFDYILVMDENNYKTVRAMAANREEADKIHLMTDYLVQFRKLQDHIPDPYYGEASGFELVLDLLEDACEGLLLNIKKEHILI
jgi:protein-tyrosine phosphatase